MHKAHQMPANAEARTIDPEDYMLTGDESEEELIALLRLPLVRLCNLYRIKDKNGKRVKFTPNAAQCRVLYEVYIAGNHRLAVPKARQLGFSTLFALIALDETHYGENQAASIVDQTQPDASEKLDKVRFAWENIPEELRHPANSDNSKELGWANGSAVQAGKNARGGTNQVLHISEWGPIAFLDPRRSEEILTGALPSASGETAKVFAESTHMGGKGGDWYELIARSLEVPEAHRTRLDFVVLFFPWYLEPAYTLAGDNRQITPDSMAYLLLKEREITKDTGKPFTFTPGQRLWYHKQRLSLGRHIFREYPTTLDECWLAPFPGAIYAPEVDKARMSGRITSDVLHYESLPVYTCFDIGAPANTKCWIFQAVGDRINLLETLTGDEDCNTPAKWAVRLKAKSYSYGSHFLPHDGAILWAQLLRDAGLENVVALQKPLNIWDNINAACGAFSRCFFHSEGCKDGLAALEAYHSKEENDGVTIKNVPVHDWSSHASTAFGYIHQAIRMGMLVDRSAMPSRPKRQHYGRPRNLTAVGASMGIGKPKRANRGGDDW